HRRCRGCASRWWAAPSAGWDGSSGASVLAHQLAGRVDLVGGLQGEGLHAGQRTSGQAGEDTGGRELDDGGDAEVEHGPAAQVPADGPGDLRDDALEGVVAGGDG